jgi:glycosyltransferase involved in cell wall biosynthesis
MKPATDTVRPLDIVCFTRQSGLFDYTLSLARAMAPSRKVRILTAQAQPGADDTADGIEIVPVFRRVRHYPIDIWRFIALVLASPPRDLLFQSWLYFPVLETLMLRAFHLRGHRLFGTVHDTLPHHPKPWSRTAFCFYYRSFDGLIAHSEAGRAGLRDLGSRAPILVVPHGSYEMYVSGRVSREAARNTLGIGAAQVAVLLFGHIDVRKGCFEFIEAARQCADIEDVLFLLVGRSQLGASDRARLAEAASLPNLRIVEGFAPHDMVEHWFIAADLIAAPYREGTTSGVYRLAMAFGRPIVAAEIGDLREAVARGAAVSLGVGDEVAGRLGDFVRTSSGDLDTVVAAPLERMAAERRAAGWPEIATRYLAFIDDMRRIG